MNTAQLQELSGIDSVCIIQSGDDGADWFKEAAQMARYYQQSILHDLRTDQHTVEWYASSSFGTPFLVSAAVAISKF